jgi:hypothetical protein
MNTKKILKRIKNLDFTSRTMGIFGMITFIFHEGNSSTLKKNPLAGKSQGEGNQLEICGRNQS